MYLYIFISFSLSLPRVLSLFVMAEVSLYDGFFTSFIRRCLVNFAEMEDGAVGRERSSQLHVLISE